MYIENSAVFGDGAGEGALNECRAFAPQFASNPRAPEVKVCGTGVKLTAYLRSNCMEYRAWSWQIGKCDAGAPPDTCDSLSPADDPFFGLAQSYIIEQC